VSKPHLRRGEQLIVSVVGSPNAFYSFRHIVPEALIDGLFVRLESPIKISLDGLLKITIVRERLFAKLY